jgi:hypothetical protein
VDDDGRRDAADLQRDGALVGAHVERLLADFDARQGR